MCDHNFACFFLEIVQDMKKKCAFFGVNYSSVTQKLRILAINAIFGPKSHFLTDSIDNSIKVKAEITSFNMRYNMSCGCDHQKSKCLFY